LQLLIRAVLQRCGDNGLSLFQGELGHALLSFRIAPAWRDSGGLTRGFIMRSIDIVGEKVIPRFAS
jgi:hypothetical protein